MGSLNFEPTDEDYEFVEALLEGLNKYAEKLSATYDETYVETHSSFSEEVDEEWRAF